MNDIVCTRCGQQGHRASHCPWPAETAAAAPTKLDRSTLRPWTEADLQALRDLYPTGGWWAVHQVTGRGKQAIWSMALKHRIRVDPASVQRLAREAEARKGSAGRPRKHPPKPPRAPRPIVQPAAPEPAEPGHRHARYIDATSPRKPSDMPRVASVFDLARSLA